MACTARWFLPLFVEWLVEFLPCMPHSRFCFLSISVPTDPISLDFFKTLLTLTLNFPVSPRTHLIHSDVVWLGPAALVPL